jgi:hypothetical protein
MPTHDTVQGQTHEIAPQKRSSTAAKLIKAAALAAVLVPLGSISPAEAASITCTFSGSNSDGGVGGEGCFGGGSSQTYDFGDYQFELTFDFSNEDVNFDVEVVATEFAALDGSLPGYQCVALTDAGCVDFQVLPYNPAYPNQLLTSSDDYWTHYTVAIDWENWNNYPLTMSNMRLLHDRTDDGGAEAVGSYDVDTCTSGMYDECEIETEPRIKSGNTDFDSYTAAVTVPEPSSLLLLGMGALATVIRRRRS